MLYQTFYIELKSSSWIHLAVKLLRWNQNSTSVSSYYFICYCAFSHNQAGLFINENT